MACTNADQFWTSPPVRPRNKDPATETQLSGATITTATRPLLCPEAAALPPSTRSDTHASGGVSTRPGTAWLVWRVLGDKWG